jgi:hypothetical protein
LDHHWLSASKVLHVKNVKALKEKIKPHPQQSN